MATIPAGAYLAIDPAFAPDSTGACTPETIAKVTALATQVPWPDRRQDVSSFAIDKQRITATDYQACAASGACASDERTTHGDRLARVTLDEAIAYCHWRGAHLPTLLQLQAVARGVEGRVSAECDAPPTSDECTFTSSLGVVIADAGDGLGEFTSTTGCWHDKHAGDARAEVRALKATPFRDQLYLFAPSGQVVGRPDRAEFRCVRN